MLAEWLVDTQLAMASGRPADPGIRALPGPVHQHDPPGSAADPRLVGRVLLDGARRCVAARGAPPGAAWAPAGLATFDPREAAAAPTLASSAGELPPEPRPPIGGPDTPSRSSIVAGTTGEWVRNVGAVMILFVLYQFFGTGVSEAHAQQRLRHELTSGSAAPGPAGLSTPGATAHAPSAAPGPRRPVPGRAVMLIRVPRIGLDAAVVEGTGLDQLAEGPGHYAGSALPGERGNTAIAGHRTTYGHPFSRLDELRVGDHIILTTAAADYDYTVAEAPRAVAPGDIGVINDFGDSRLTLTTCNPKYSASQRLVVVGHLAQPPATAQAPAAAAPAATPGQARLASAGPVGLADETGWRGNLADWLAACLCAGLLVGAWLARGWVTARSGRALGWLFAAPTLMAVLMAMFERLNHILPANW